MTERVGLDTADFVAKQDNINPPIRGTLLDPDDNPIDLTGSSVRFHMTAELAGAVKIDGAASILAPPTAGRVEYQWVATDLDTTGWFSIEWEVTDLAGDITSVPNFGYDKVYVTGKIA